MATNELVVNKWSIICFIAAVVAVFFIWVIPLPIGFWDNNAVTLYNANHACSSEILGVSVSGAMDTLGSDKCSNISIGFWVTVALLFVLIAAGIFFLIKDKLPDIKIA
jgi:hypothetical protein